MGHELSIFITTQGYANPPCPATERRKLRGEWRGIIAECGIIAGQFASGESVRGKKSTPERTPGGSEIIRATEPEPIIYSDGKKGIIQSVDRHIEKHIGPVNHVWHQEKSEYVHLDIHVVPANKDRAFHALVTSGMSELPMLVPSIARPFQFGELVLLLPDGERLPDSKTKEEERWPIQLLTYLGRYPHRYRTWLAAGHTMAEPASLGESDFSAVLLGPSSILDPEFHVLRYRKRETHFWSIWPIYEEELQFKLQHGSDALFEEFAQEDMTELFDPCRKNVITGKIPNYKRKLRHH